MKAGSLPAMIGLSVQLSGGGYGERVRLYCLGLAIAAALKLFCERCAGG
ncbi:hypothetical protein Metal_0676 [Methylomicrobium album BG8]|uniref:Uncharacterized protein n=1 Tax=Methylomicrobium album BG8 TaxID=686340 RepID=H8GPQ3_METAL|nr:hypothetical protein Metal_0676 [Methylomicrobium album BG8]